MPPKSTINKSSGKKKKEQPGPIPRPPGVATTKDVHNMTLGEKDAFFVSIIDMSESIKTRILCAIVNDKNCVPRNKTDDPEQDVKYLNGADPGVLVLMRHHIRDKATWAIEGRITDEAVISRKVVTTVTASCASEKFPDIYTTRDTGLIAGRYAEFVIKKVKELAKLAGIPTDGIEKHVADDGRPDWANPQNHANGTGFAWCEQIEPIVVHVLWMESIEKIHELSTLDGIVGLSVAPTTATTMTTSGGDSSNASQSNEEAVAEPNE